jgi:hypothetical protein
MKILPVLFAGVLMGPLAWGQEPPPSRQSLEPRVDTSARPAAPASEKPPAGEKAPAATTPAASAPAEAPRTQGNQRGTRGVMDRLELDTTQITGNRELPKVLYIVPWKQSDLGDLMGRPANSLLDEVLAPVDRDVFRRENRYYDALQPDGVQRTDKPEK